MGIFTTGAALYETGKSLGIGSGGPGWLKQLGLDKILAKSELAQNYLAALEYQPQITEANASANIKGTVAGANASGLHPLFALGGGAGGNSPAFSLPGQSPTGSHRDIGGILEGLSRLETNKQNKLLTESQLKDAELRRQLVQLQIDNLKNRPSVAPGPHDASEIQRRINDNPIMTSSQAEKETKSQVEVTPDPYITRNKNDSSVSAAKKPAWMEVEIAPGVSVQVLWSEEGPAESMENLPAVAAAVARNSYLGYKKAYNALLRLHSRYYRGKGRHPLNQPRTKFRSSSAGPHIPYSRGPHR